MGYRPKAVDTRIHTGAQPSKPSLGDLWLDGFGRLHVRTPSGWSAHPHKRVSKLFAEQRKRDFDAFHTRVIYVILGFVFLIVSCLIWNWR